MKKTITTLLSISCLVLVNNVAISQEVRQFGQPGNSGRNGIDGRDGSNNSDRKIVADTSDREIDLSGTDGEDATEGEDGDNASNCQQPLNTPYFLQGANGGNGGRGGRGGNGGNGGSATIFYTDPANLKNITLDNSGGEGGKGYRGGRGGMGCQVQVPHWQIKYCAWELWVRKTDIADSQWQKEGSGHETTQCTGVEHIDARSHTPPAPHLSHNIAYQWKYLGITRTDSYSANPGVQGQNGNDGEQGKKGEYGRVWLIPRMDIPVEKISHDDLLNNLIGKKIDLTRNIWVNRQGLSSLLNPNSDVPDRYTYLLSTANLSYRIVWAAKQTPAELEINDIQLGGEITLEGTNPQLAFRAENIPGTIEYDTKTENNMSTLTVVGGFEPSRIKSFRVIDNNSDRKPHELILVDDGKVRELLTDTKFTVTTFVKRNNGDYQQRDTVEFKLPPNKPATGSMSVNDYQYTLNLGNSLFPWLSPDSDADLKHLITITQTTKRGVVYQQEIEYERIRSNALKTKSLAS